MNVTMMLAILGATLASFMISILSAPILIKKLKAHGIVGVDVHKPLKPVCAEMGGIIVLLGFIGGFAIYMLLSAEIDLDLLLIFTSIAFVGLIGVVDDLVVLRQRYKPFLVALASVPLVFTSLGHTAIWFPFVGFIEFGALYPIIVIFGVATSSNLTNMLAGFNGLEAGIGMVSCFTLGLFCIMTGKPEAAVIALPLSSAFLALLRSNWFPAKIFPGDTGTLISGAALASIAVFGRVEFAGMIMIVPAAIDFTLKMVTKSPFSHRKEFGDTHVDEAGNLVPPPYPALAHMFMKVDPMSEKKLVSSLLFMQIFYCVIGILLTLLFC